MELSSFIRARQFKSPLSVIAGFLLRSREFQVQRALALSEEVKRLERTDHLREQELTRANEELAEKKCQIAELKIEVAHLREQPPVLPQDPPLRNHLFGPKMIALTINLARKVGLRASIVCLEIIMDWLGISVKLPVWTTVRTWMMRQGVAALEAPVEEADDWVWMVDHSNQIGQEKALAVIGIRASNMPPPGVAIRHEDVRLLMLEPGVNWKTEDMSAAYERLAEKIGHPLAVLTDGACELRDGARTLQKNEENTIILGDFKHYAANVLKKVMGNDERFTRFTSRAGHTRSSIQQTELAHLTPVSPRPKARFMNLAAMLQWANVVQWHLAHPFSIARQTIPTERMNDKLGWLREHRQDVLRWSRCQDVVSTSVTFVNKQGLFHGAADQLAQRLGKLNMCKSSQAVSDQLLRFIREHEAMLADGQRLPMSTEILESCFGLYKQLERQHSKGGFTSLLAAFGALLQPATPESIRESFTRVSVKQMKTWVSDNLGTTVTSKRQTAYAEFKTAA